MMNKFEIPVTILENFFPDPNFLVEYSKTLDYTSASGNHNFPGVRCKIEQKNPELFSFIINSVLSLFVKIDEETRWEASLAFQITNSELKEGWIHQDDGSVLAFILYLNENPDPNSGTSVFERKFYDDSIETEKTKQLKRATHRGELPLDDNYFDHLKRYNSQFEETIEIKNKFNRLLVFDSNTYHGVKKFVDDRLTMAGFIYKLNGKKYY